MPLKSRDTWPPGGFQFLQPQISPKLISGMGFNDTVNRIIELRRANPRFGLSLNKAAVGDELDAYNTARLKAMPGCESYIIEDTGGPLPKFVARAVPAPSKGVAAAGIKKPLEGVRRATVGIGVLMDWLGAGLKPVPKELAEKRALVCVDCPQNKPANLIQWVFSRVANSISLLIQAKNDLQCSTSQDAKLFACQACDCHLGLKVHCPLEHILAREKPEAMAKLDQQCWVLKEQQ